MMALYNVTAKVYSGGTPTPDGSATRNGVSPFAPVISPGTVSAEMSLAVDANGVTDKGGLGSAFYEANTSFQIESRDR